MKVSIVYKYVFGTGAAITACGVGIITAIIARQSSPAAASFPARRRRDHSTAPRIAGICHHSAD